MLNVITEALNKWKNVPHLRLERLSVAKMAISSKLHCGFSVIPMRIPDVFFAEINKLIKKW